MGALCARHVLQTAELYFGSFAAPGEMKLRLRLPYWRGAKASGISGAASTPSGICATGAAARAVDIWVADFIAVYSYRRP